MSIRLPSAVRERLHRKAARTGEPPSSLAARLVDEGLRTSDHPLIVFRNTPGGARVAGLVGGPDVAEVINVLTGLESRDEQRITEAAEWLGLHHSTVRAALAYYGEFSDEIDAELELRRRAAEDLRVQLARQRSVL